MDGQGRPGLARGVKDKWKDPAAFMVVGPLPSSTIDSLRRTLALKRVLTAVIHLSILSGFGTLPKLDLPNL